MLVTVSLIGCDDTTEFKLEVTGEQLNFLLDLESISKHASKYGCMPTLQVELVKWAAASTPR